MALIINETRFIRGGGHEPADCVLYGNFSSTAGETQFLICPGNPTNTTVVAGSSSITDMRFISFQCTTAGGDSSPYPVASKQFNNTLNRYEFFVSIETADTEWNFKIDGIDNGDTPVV